MNAVKLVTTFGLAFAAVTSPAQAPAEDPAAKFGAREQVIDISLSPDGRKVAYVAAREGSGSGLYTVDLADMQPRLATAADGNPLRLQSCNWVSNERLVCLLYAYQDAGDDIVVSTRLVAINADGTGPKLLSQRPGMNALYFSGYGGGILDYLPAENNAVLMGHYAIPEARIGSLIEKRDEGFMVRRVDTLTGKASTIESAKAEAIEYMSDGRGTIRIMGVQPRMIDGYSKPAVNYFFREKGSREWKPLGRYDVLTGEGFSPYAIDPDKNIVYGFQKMDGRKALYTIKLSEGLPQQLVYAHPEVDVDTLVRIGRQRRVVGVTYATDKRRAEYFDPEVAAMARSLSKALPHLPQTHVVDSSADGNKMLLWAGSDVDPGNYFVFDRAAKRLNKIMLARPELDGTRLAEVRPIRYRAADGAMVPGYLTLPPGSSGKGLPAIVMPHGGPEARDEWGFDWLAQFFAHRGYAVLQPNFRGSTGYGDAWFQKNGFQSWRIAVGDVADGGRWLVGEGIADPAKLAIVGWSYGGYAALQSGVVAPDLFKAIVAIAPVTDFRMTMEESRYTSAAVIERARIGSGTHLLEGSPLQNVTAIKAPVLMFHGDQDVHVRLRQSRVMHDRLKAAGKRSELVEFKGLAHQLDDSSARSELLRKSDAFLRRAMGM
jgi:dipeptidyl aminopeptidase/acylaminoacyl peptidase